MGLFNITSATTTTLIPIYKDRGSISSIIFTNAHATADVNIQLFLEDDEPSPNKYYILSTDVPAKVSLFLNEDLGFNNNNFALKLTTQGSGLDLSNPLTVIVK